MINASVQLLVNIVEDTLLSNFWFGWEPLIIYGSFNFVHLSIVFFFFLSLIS